MCLKVCLSHLCANSQTITPVLHSYPQTAATNAVDTNLMWCVSCLYLFEYIFLIPVCQMDIDYFLEIILSYCHGEYSFSLIFLFWHNREGGLFMCLVLSPRSLQILPSEICLSIPEITSPSTAEASHTCSQRSHTWKPHTFCNSVMWRRLNESSESLTSSPLRRWFFFFKKILLC